MTIREICKKNGYKFDNGVLDVSGACNECVAGQMGKLNRPFGQGHIYCSPIPDIIIKYIERGDLFIRFHNNRWEIVEA